MPMSSAACADVLAGLPLQQTDLWMLTEVAERRPEGWLSGSGYLHAHGSLSTVPRGTRSMTRRNG